MSLYLDASVLVPLFVDEPMTAAVVTWLSAQSDNATVSRLAAGETASALSRRYRTGELSDEQRLEALATSDEWFEFAVNVVDNEPEDIAQASKFVRRPTPKLLMPDAIHLATCRRLGSRLVTRDKPLAIVAGLLRIDHVVLD